MQEKKKTLNHIDLFSGIGGFALAATWCWGKEYNNVGHSEIEDFPCRVYHKHFPGSKCLGDITKINWKEYAGRIELITGGFPCQPFSVAGKQRGREDNRFLWHEMLRAIQEVRPTWVIGENVAGIVEMELERVCVDLENSGYEVQPFVIPACAVGAPHRRDRVWIIANRKGIKNSTLSISREYRENIKPAWQFRGSDISRDWRETASRVCRNDDGLLHRVDRLKSLGNAIVPQVAYEIMLAMKSIETQDVKEGFK